MTLRRPVTLLGKVFLLGLLAVTSAGAESGVAVVDSVVGRVEATGIGVAFAPGAHFDPTGLELRTGDGGFAALVFSNGCAVYLAPASRLRVDRFEQRPFEARPDDLEFEPSRSTLELTLLEGGAGIAQRTPNPASDFIVFCGGLEARLTAPRAVFARKANEDIVVIFDGRAEIREGEWQHLLRGGQAIREQGAKAAHIEAISEDETETWEPWAAAAAVALKRWYFFTPEGQLLVPQRIVENTFLKSVPYNNTRLINRGPIKLFPW